MGITSGNYMSMESSPAVDRLLDSNLGLGTDDNPLPATWMRTSSVPSVTTERHITTLSVTVPSTELPLTGMGPAVS